MRTAIGLDLSLTSTGIATAEGDHVRTLRVRSTGKAGASWNARGQRIVTLAHRITDEVPSGSAVFIESPSYASASTSMHDRSGLWWMVWHELTELGCIVVPVAPSQRAKYATGRGNAGKDEVLAAVVRRYPDVEVEGNDDADALAILAFGLRALGRPIDDPMPKVNTAALAKFELPDELA